MRASVLYIRKYAGILNLSATEDLPSSIYYVVYIYKMTTLGLCLTEVARM